MFKHTATDLTNVSIEVVEKWLNSFDTVLTDCDGVLWINNKIIDGSPNVIHNLQKLGKNVYFVTNNPNQTRSELHKHAQMLGFKISENQIITAPYATAKYLQKRNFTKKAYLIGWAGVAQELDAVGIRHSDPESGIISKNFFEILADGEKLDPEIGAVVVGFDVHFNYRQVLMAANYLTNPECLFLGIAADERFVSKGGLVVPGTAILIRAIETCTHRSATIMGKPDPLICESFSVDANLMPERTLIIGDSANTDILLGTNCGFQTLLVGTGTQKWDDVQRWRASGSDEEKKLLPDVYLPKLEDLLPFLNNRSKEFKI